MTTSEIIKDAEDKILYALMTFGKPYDETAVDIRNSNLFYSNIEDLENYPHNNTVVTVGSNQRIVRFDELSPEVQKALMAEDGQDIPFKTGKIYESTENGMREFQTHIL